MGAGKLEAELARAPRRGQPRGREGVEKRRTVLVDRRARSAQAVDEHAIARIGRVVGAELGDAQGHRRSSAGRTPWVPRSRPPPRLRRLRASATSAGVSSPPMVRSASAASFSALRRARRTISSGIGSSGPLGVAPPGRSRPPRRPRSSDARRVPAPRRGRRLACRLGRAPRVRDAAPRGVPGRRPPLPAAARRRTRAPPPPPAPRCVPSGPSAARAAPRSMTRVDLELVAPLPRPGEREQLAHQTGREELHADHDEQVGEHEQRPVADRLAEGSWRPVR